MIKQDNTSEFSHIIEVENLLPIGETRSIAAEAAECASIARRLELVALHALSARITLAPWRESGWKISGTVNAEIEQQCVVTADDFRSTCEFELEYYFMGENDQAREGREIVVDPLCEDEPDEIIDGRFNLAELVVESLALSLDPYPRKPGAKFEAARDEGIEDAVVAQNSPFAVLAKLNQSD